MTGDCVFCKIRDGQIPSAKVYEDERTFAIMDINPLNPGHTLVIIKTHEPTLFDVDTADLVAAVTAAKRVARALRDALKPDGINMMQANGAAAFQSVPHLHLHLIPRFVRDGKGFDWKLEPGNRDEILTNAEKIRAALGGTS
jgi:histidine triad (HIT) family protein